MELNSFLTRRNPSYAYRTVCLLSNRDPVVSASLVTIRRAKSLDPVRSEQGKREQKGIHGGAGNVNVDTYLRVQ